MSIRLRFTLFGIGFLLVLFSLVFFVFRFTDGLRGSLTELEGGMIKIGSINAFDDSVKEMASSIQIWSISGRTDHMERYLTALSDSQTAMASMVLAGVDGKFVADIERDWAEIRDISGDIIRDPASRREKISAIDSIGKRIVVTIDGYRRGVLRDASRAAESGRRAGENSASLLIFFAAAGAVAAAVLIIVVKRTIERPFEQMLLATEKVSAGDLTHRINPEGSDEFSVIARRFDRMVGHLSDSEEMLIERLGEAELLLDVARLAGLISEREGMLKLISEAVGKGLRKDLCIIYLADRDKKGFYPRAVNREHIPVNACLQADTELVANLLSRPSTLEFRKGDDRFGAFDSVCPDCGSLLFAPIMMESRCLGLFVLGSKAEGGFTGDEARMSLILAHNIGIAVRNMELYEDTERKVKHLSIVHELNRTLTTVFTPQEVLDTITSKAAMLINARGCVIRLVEGEYLRAASVYGLPGDEKVEPLLPLGAGIPGMAVTKGGPVLISDITEMSEEVRKWSIIKRSVIIVPLKAGEKIIGTLGLYDKIGPEGELASFSADDLSIADGFASISAVTIEKASMLSEARTKESELLEAKRRYELLFESVHGGIVTLDRDFKITSANRFAGRWADMPYDKMAGLSVIDIFHDKGGICPHCAANATFDTGDINTITQSNGLNYAELTSYPIKDASGKAVEAVVFILDITDRVLYQEEIMGLYKEVARTKDYLESLINNTADAIITLNISGMIESWNPGAERIFGFSASEAVKRPMPNVLEPVSEILAQAVKRATKGEVFNLDTYLKTKSGATVEASLTMSPIKDITGEIIGISSIVRDITGRKKIERELIRRNQELSRLFFISSAMRGTLEIDKLLRMVLTAVTMGDGLGFNRAVLFMLDKDRGIIRGEMGIGPESHDEAWKIWKDISSQKMTLQQIMDDIEQSPPMGGVFQDKLGKGIEVPLDGDTVLARAAREKVSYNVTGFAGDFEASRILAEKLGTKAYAVVPLVSRGNLIGLLWVDNLFNQRPITDEDLRFLSGFANQMASAIESASLFRQISLAEAELENIFRSISDMVYFTDKEYTLRNVNDAVVKKIGRPASEIIGKKCYEIFHGTDAPASQCPHHKTMQTMASHIEEVEDAYLGGTFLSSTSPIFDSGRNFLGTVHVVRDISELTDLRDRLVVAERKAALGEVAARVAHEIRNPLVSVGGFAERLEKKLDGNLKEYAGIILKEVIRLEGILRDILGFVRETRMQERIVDLNDHLGEVVDLLGNEVSQKGNRLHRDFQAEPLWVYIDPNRMKEAFLNIVTNANHATDGGEITLRTYIRYSDAVAEVADTGHGIRPEDLENIFNPFFTTRPSGTGLGLAIAKRIVEEHRGRIEVVSRPEFDGTKFTVYLPLKEVLDEDNGG